jgi:hypothetical protein
MRPAALVLVLGIGIMLLVSGYLWVSQSHAQNPSDMDRMIPPGILPTASREDLKDIILNNPNASMREKGVIALTGLSVDQSGADDSVAFLKNVTVTDKDENVRRTALASMGLIRAEFPLPLQGDMKVTVVGDIKKNANITIATDITSKTDQDRVRVGILYLYPSMTLFTPQEITTTLSANQPAHAEFIMSFQEEGEYIIRMYYIIDRDAFEYEKVEKRVGLTVHNEDGTYIII